MHWQPANSSHHYSPMILRSALSLTLTAAAATLLLTGCGSSRDEWDPENPPEVANAGTRIVLFAPVDAGAVTEVHATAGVDYARDLADRIDLLVDDADAWYGQTLPVSSDAQWDAGPVGAASGAHLVVLSRVLSVEEVDAPNGTNIVATVEMRAVDQSGQAVWGKTSTGRVSAERSPKMMRDSGHPISKAAWEASRKNLLSLISYLGDLPDPRFDDPTTDPAPEPAVLVDVSVDSVPSNADIYIDGVFRGTTPAVVPMPVRELTLRVQRQGFQPWEATFVPESELAIAPALEPLAGSQPAE